jgi:glyceraldehyde 3-phosphate dehydrogenase
MNILLNGIGRIGKAIFKIALNDSDINIVAINELNINIQNIAYSINYDSTYGKIDDKFIVSNNFIKNSISKVIILNHFSLKNIDFKKYNIDIIIDSSGSKIDTKVLSLLKVSHIFLTHPTQKADINIILGVNETNFNKKTDKIVSTSSCNATALLPILKLIDKEFNIEYGDINTVHPLLNHQKTLDSNCVSNDDREVECSFEFGRSSMQNIIPSATTTIDACSYILPKINHNIISSSSLRVPTATVGVINVILIVKKNCSKEYLLNILKDFEKNQKHKIILNNFYPLVSSDFEKEEFTTIVDHRFTDVKQNKMIKLVLWYDNEWGYASKVVDIIKESLC